MKIAGIVLAAGGSTRLGSPKQLLEYGGRTLLRRAVETVLATMCRPVVVVLGSGAETLRAELAGLDVRIAVNPDWERGMGSSVRSGMAALAREEIDAVLLTLCDQPLIGREALDRLIAAWRAGSPGAIAAAGYNRTLGVPVVFGRGYFAGLAALLDPAGAKSVLQRHAEQVIVVPMPEAATDIDTHEQYEELPPPQAPSPSLNDSEQRCTLIKSAPA